MFTRDRKDIDRGARTAGAHGLKSLAKTGRAGAGWSSAGERKVQWSEIDQDHLTVVSLSIIAALSALSVMLWCPERCLNLPSTATSRSFPSVWAIPSAQAESPRYRREGFRY